MTLLTYAQLIPGNIYVINEGTKYILLIEKNRDICRNIEISKTGRRDYFRDGWFEHGFRGAHYKEASEQEANWLRECIKHDRFIPLENISIPSYSIY